MHESCNEYHFYLAKSHVELEFLAKTLTWWNVGFVWSWTDGHVNLEELRIASLCKVGYIQFPGGVVVCRSAIRDVIVI